jgi:hypothetical protein
MRQRLDAVGVTTTTVTAALMLAQGPSAGAADDVTPPTLSLPKSGAPLLGSQVGGDEGPGVNGLMARTDMATSWHAEDASEVCGYRVSEFHQHVRTPRALRFVGARRTWGSHTQASRESQQAPESEGQDAEDLFLSKVQLKSARQVAKRFAHVRVKIDGDAVTALPTRADGPGWSHIPQESAGHVTSPTDDQLGEVVVRVFKLCRPTIDLNSPN